MDSLESSPPSSACLRLSSSESSPDSGGGGTAVSADVTVEMGPCAPGELRSFAELLEEVKEGEDKVEEVTVGKNSEMLKGGGGKVVAAEGGILFLRPSRLSTSISTSESLSSGGGDGLVAEEDGGQGASGATTGTSPVALLFRGRDSVLSPGVSAPLRLVVLGPDGGLGTTLPRGRGVSATLGATALSRLL